MKIAITTSTFAQFSDEPLRLLGAAGIEVVQNPFGRQLTEDEAIDLLAGCAGVAAGTEPLTARLMAALPELRVISRCGVGMDNVDAGAAATHGIVLRNTPDGPTLAVAELVLGYALDLLRRITQMDRDLRMGVWKKRMGNTLRGKKLGIIGFGRIGQAVAALFAPCGVDLAFTDPRVQSESCRSMPLHDLLAWAEIVTLHCSKPAGQGYLIGASELERLRPGGWIINAARGGVLDEDALCDALQAGHLAGAAVDVFGQEPYHGPLVGLANVILTPHIGSYAVESRIQMEIDTIRNLIECLPPRD